CRAHLPYCHHQAERPVLPGSWLPRHYLLLFHRSLQMLSFLSSPLSLSSPFYRPARVFCPVPRRSFSPFRVPPAVPRCVLLLFLLFRRVFLKTVRSQFPSHLRPRLGSIQLLYNS